MQRDLSELEARLWDVADELRANSGLKSSEYGTPVLGSSSGASPTRSSRRRERIEAKASARRTIGPSDHQAGGVIYLTAAAGFDHLLSLPESADLGKAINDAMRAVEAHNPDLAGILPKSYTSIEHATLASLLRHINGYTKNLEGDAFGLIYEYFLAKFAIAEGQGAGEFFTSSSIVRLIVEVIEPFYGRIFDPACGSGGMFVHSAHFVERHRHSPGDELSVYGHDQPPPSPPTAACSSDPWPLLEMTCSNVGMSPSGGAFRRRSSSPRTTPKRTWRQVPWASARQLPLSPGSSSRAGCTRSTTSVSGQVAACSARPASGPRLHEGSGSRGAMLA
jgi:type I restriction-modification system DNA methylase subunit